MIFVPLLLDVWCHKLKMDVQINTRDQEKKGGYIFYGYFDIALYLVLVIIYPLLCYFLQSKQIDINNTNTCYDLIVTGLFYLLSFYYDFYSKYKECDDAANYVITVLFIGRLIFAVLSIGMIVCTAFLFNIPFTEKILTRGSYGLIGTSTFPLFIVLNELCVRLHRDFRGKISKVKV